MQLTFVCRALTGLALVLLLSAPAEALDVAEARHLLVRTGFAAPIHSVEALLPLSREDAVKGLLEGARPTAITPPPSNAEKWYPDPWYEARVNGLSKQGQVAQRRQMRSQMLGLKVWWYREMVATPSPLTERMTLFWHNHFTSSTRSVQHPVLMYRQNKLLRAHALGNFGELLRAIGRDPAMMRYLDTVQNQANAPNENYARELLELFTLGEGHYTEADIKHVARAFTGWIVDQETGQAAFRSGRHDFGIKTIFGMSGTHDSDSTVELLLIQPRTATFIVEKLWRNFISDDPDRDEIERLSRLFRTSDYELRPLMHALLTSSAFWSKENRGVLIKSPVELIVGTIRQFNILIDQPEILVQAGARLGQNVFDPPNVAGWPGGTAWISSDTLLARNDLIRAMVGEESASNNMTKQTQMPRLLDRWATNLGPDWQSTIDIVTLLLPIDPVDFEVDDSTPSGALLRELLADPAYQLK